MLILGLFFWYISQFLSEGLGYIFEEEMKINLIGSYSYWILIFVFADELFLAYQLKVIRQKSSGSLL